MYSTIEIKLTYLLTFVMHKPKSWCIKNSLISRLYSEKLTLGVFTCSFSLLPPQHVNLAKRQSHDNLIFLPVFPGLGLLSDVYSTYCPGTKTTCKSRLPCQVLCKSIVLRAAWNDAHSGVLTFNMSMRATKDVCVCVCGGGGEGGGDKSISICVICQGVCFYDSNPNRVSISFRYTYKGMLYIRSVRWSISATCEKTFYEIGPLFFFFSHVALIRHRRSEYKIFNDFRVNRKHSTTCSWT